MFTALKQEILVITKTRREFRAFERFGKKKPLTQVKELKRKCYVLKFPSSFEKCGMFILNASNIPFKQVYFSEES